MNIYSSFSKLILLISSMGISTAIAEDLNTTPLKNSTQIITPKSIKTSTPDKVSPKTAIRIPDKSSTIKVIAFELNQKVFTTEELVTAHIIVNNVASLIVSIQYGSANEKNIWTWKNPAGRKNITKTLRLNTSSFKIERDATLNLYAQKKDGTIYLKKISHLKPI